MNDVVRKPSHYQIADGIEAIDLIELIVNAYDLSPHEGYLLGNFLKYRLRLGDKDSVEQDLAKSNEYRQRLRESREETSPGHSECDGDCENCEACKPPFPVPCTTERENIEFSRAALERRLSEELREAPVPKKPCAMKLGPGMYPNYD